MKPFECGENGVDMIGERIVSPIISQVIGERKRRRNSNQNKEKILIAVPPWRSDKDRHLLRLALLRERKREGFPIRLCSVFRKQY